MVPQNTLEESQKQRCVSCCPAVGAERGAAGCRPARGSWPCRDPAASPAAGSVPRESWSPAGVGLPEGHPTPRTRCSPPPGPMGGVAEDDQLVTLAWQSRPVICPWSWQQTRRFPVGQGQEEVDRGLGWEGYCNGVFRRRCTTWLLKCTVPVL